MNRPRDPTSSPSSIDPLHAITLSPPQFSPGEVTDVLQVEYGLQGSLSSLVSERDQNFRLTSAGGTQYIVRIANAAEERVVTDCQAKALLCLEHGNCPVNVPRIQPTLSGDSTASIANSDTRHFLRVVSYVPGKPLAEIALNHTLARRLGVTLAALDAGLSEFRHPGESPALLWDIQRAVGLRPLLAHIADAELRAVVGGCLDDFEVRVLPQLAALRHQVIHSDFNPGNVLINDDAQELAGVIDFGDMLYAPLIVDVAIAASYLRHDSNPTLYVAPFVAAYDGHTGLTQAELGLLYDLIRTRLATTITLLWWRLAARDESDPYREQTLEAEGGAHRFLIGLNAIPRDDFRSFIVEACSR
jgi:Ser/Thr protein kinase RdoA (MazF antagonist)